MVVIIHIMMQLLESEKLNDKFALKAVVSIVEGLIGLLELQDRNLLEGGETPLSVEEQMFCYIQWCKCLWWYYSNF